METNPEERGRAMLGDNCRPNRAHSERWCDSECVEAPITIMPSLQHDDDRRQDEADLDSSVRSSGLDHVPMKLLVSFPCPAVASAEKTRFTPTMSCDWNFS